MLNLSYLKLFAGVFFALFILSACGGGGGDAAAPAATGGGAVTCTDANQHAVNDVCTDYTQATCESASKHWNDTACVTDNYAMLADSHFNTDEYKTSGTLLRANAKAGYLNIENLINADNMAAADSAIKQGGEGQIISIASDENHGFNTTHQEFTESGVTGAAFNLVYNASSSGTSYDTNAKIVNNSQGNCSNAQCYGSQYAALVAGRKGSGDMHGIAYNAKLNAIITDDSQAQLANALKKDVGVGENIVVMNYTLDTEYVTACYVDGSANRTYVRPKGLKVASSDCSSNTLTDSDPLSATELQRWKDAVSVNDIDDATNANDGNNTIMVFSAGGSGSTSFNSENGGVYSGNVSNVQLNPIDVMGNVKDANIPSYLAAYPALYTESGTDFTSDRWLVVVGLNAAGTQILSNSNGCGDAMHFCLAASGATNTTTANGSNNTTYLDTGVNASAAHASSTVAGAMAVLKGAFPNATPEQLTALVLETSDPIAPTINDDASLYEQATDKDGNAITGRMVNAVYGWGKLNLETATSASASSYVTASNNESMGALWQDTKLTLSSHFGGNFESVKFGIGDAYGRHFITDAPQTNYAPIAISLDDYMANMLGDDSQSQTLGTQAQLNYSNSGETWMNLEYISGKATTKIAFQDSYKINPLSDTGTTTILRANNIRPASTNIGMMDVDYQLGSALSLSSYLARGEYDTGYKFDELGTDFDVNYKDSHLNIAIGNIREHGQFLGTNTSGAYALNAPSISRFTDVTYGHNIGGKFNIYANYINYETDVDMLHDQFASIDNLQADQYQIGFTGKGLMSKDDSLNVALITKLGVTDGALNQNTVLGYTADGAFNNASQSYDLAVGNRHQQFEITYQGRLYQNADKISALRDNRFFTSIRVDSNLNHVQGASQVEVVSGINVRY